MSEGPYAIVAPTHSGMDPDWAVWTYNVNGGVHSDHRGRFDHARLGDAKLMRDTLNHQTQTLEQLEES